MQIHQKQCLIASTIELQTNRWQFKNSSTFLESSLESFPSNSHFFVILFQFVEDLLKFSRVEVPSAHGEEIYHVEALRDFRLYAAHAVY